MSNLLTPVDCWCSSTQDQIIISNQIITNFPVQWFRLSKSGNLCGNTRINYQIVLSLKNCHALELSVGSNFCYATYACGFQWSFCDKGKRYLNTGNRYTWTRWPGLCLELGCLSWRTLEFEGFFFICKWFDDTMKKEYEVLLAKVYCFKDDWILWQVIENPLISLHENTHILTKAGWIWIWIRSSTSSPLGIFPVLEARVCITTQKGIKTPQVFLKKLSVFKIMPWDCLLTWRIKR